MTAGSTTSSDASAALSPSRVRAKVFCPCCCAQVEALILFRYGEPGEFQLGDRVRGIGAARVVADAFVDGPCLACAWEGAWPVEVWLARDQLESVRPPSRRFNWVSAGSYIALES